MFPHHIAHKEMLEVAKRKEATHETDKWIIKRFNGSCDYLFMILDEFIQLKEKFEPLKKYLDLIGNCEYCKYYIGTSPNVRRLKNIGVLYGCCTKTLHYFAVKYNHVCLYWKAKEFWEDVLFWKMEKQVFKLKNNNYQLNIDSRIEQKLYDDAQKYYNIKSKY
jgi:hypothetical protein